MTPAARAPEEAPMSQDVAESRPHRPRIAQIAVCATDMNGNDLWALCSDGSLWRRMNMQIERDGELYWQKWERVDDPFEDAARIEREVAAHAEQRLSESGR